MNELMQQIAAFVLVVFFGLTLVAVVRQVLQLQDARAASLKMEEITAIISDPQFSFRHEQEATLFMELLYRSDWDAALRLLAIHSLLEEADAQ